jgi:hypothetical protein
VWAALDDFRNWLRLNEGSRRESGRRARLLLHPV